MGERLEAARRLRCDGQPGLRQLSLAQHDDRLRILFLQRQVFPGVGTVKECQPRPPLGERQELERGHRLLALRQPPLRLCQLFQPPPAGPARQLQGLCAAVSLRRDIRQCRYDEEYGHRG